MSRLEAVRAKVIEAVPEIETRFRRRIEELYGHTVAVLPDYTITLADVLRAIWKFYPSCLIVGMDGHFIHNDMGDPISTEIYWNLALPLDEQEPEVIEFLANVLAV